MKIYEYIYISLSQTAHATKKEKNQLYTVLYN